MSKHMTVSELIKVLSKMQAEHGDLEISIKIPQGGSYSLCSDEDVQLVHYYDIFGNKIRMIEIG